MSQEIGYTKRPEDNGAEERPRSWIRYEIDALSHAEPFSASLVRDSR